MKATNQEPARQVDGVLGEDEGVPEHRVQPGPEPAKTAINKPAAPSQA